DFEQSYCFHGVFFFQAEDGIRDRNVTGVQTCALPILKIWMTCSPAEESFSYPARTKRKILWISYSGSRKKTASRSGMHRGAKDVRDGTSNARKCPENIWASRLTFMPAAKILFSRIMKMR